MLFKKLHKNKLINLALLIIGFLIVGYFYKNYYFDKKKEGLANNCPKGCVKDIGKDGNCRDGVCPMICSNYTNQEGLCHYDTDCSGCPTSTPSKKHKPHGSHTIGGNPSTWSPDSIIDGNHKPSTSPSSKSMSDSSNTTGYNWSKIGSKVGKIIADSFNLHHNNQTNDNQHHSHHNSDQVQNQWNNTVLGN